MLRYKKYYNANWKKIYDMIQYVKYKYKENKKGSYREIIKMVDLE